MKLKLFFSVYLISTFAFGQNRSVKINHENFEFINLKTDSTSLLTIDIFRKNKKILSHTLYNEDGDCSSIQVELGAYEIKGNQIIFYTYWVAADLQGYLLYPFGFRKKVFSVNNAGKLKLIKAEIYIEDAINDVALKEIPNLQKNPKTKTEKELLAKYINAVEQKYNAHFVNYKEKNTLQKEVRKKLEKEIQTVTKDWEKNYGSRAKF